MDGTGQPIGPGPGRGIARRRWGRFRRPALLGPHAYFDLIRMARKGRTVLLRVGFLLALLGGIAHTYEQHQLLGRTTIDGENGHAGRLNRMGHFNARCVYTLFALQNLAILLLTPAYVGGAIADERERGTLDLLFTSGLRDHEIVLGKMTARLLHLAGFLVAGLPVLFLMQVWGGVDAAIVLSNGTFSLLLLFAAASASLMISTLPAGPTTCVVTSYAVVLPAGLCCLGLQMESAAEAAPWHSTSFQVLLTALAGAAVFCLFVSTCALRGDADLPPLEEVRGFLKVQPSEGGAGLPALPRPCEVSNELPRRPLPPIGDDALHWKERSCGARTLLELREAQFIASFGLTLWVFGTVLAFLGLFQSGMLASYPTLAQCLTDHFGLGIYVLYAGALTAYCVEVTFRATASVVRERQRHTLDLLLLLPLDRRLILRAKALGVLIRGWPWLAVLAVDVVVGLLIGAYHPLSALYLVLLPCPIVVFLCAGGLLVSVVADTLLKANVIVAGALIALGIAAWHFEVPASVADIGLVHTVWNGPHRLTPEVVAVVAGFNLVCGGLAFAFYRFAVAAFRRV